MTYRLTKLLRNVIIVSETSLTGHCNANRQVIPSRTSFYGFFPALYKDDITLSQVGSGKGYCTLTDPYHIQCIFRGKQNGGGGIRNTATGDSVDVSCFYFHMGPSWIHF